MLSTNEDTLSGICRTRFIIAKSISLHVRARSHLGRCTDVPLRENRVVRELVLRRNSEARNICTFVGIALYRTKLSDVMVLVLGNGGENRHTMRMVGGGKRTESTCLRKNRRTLEEYSTVRVSRGLRKELTVHHLLGNATHLVCRKSVGRRSTYPKDDYDIESKTSNTRGYSALTCTIYQRKPSPYLTLPFLNSVTSNTQIRGRRTRFAYFLLELVDESLF